MMQLVLAASSEDYLMQLQTLLLEQCGQLNLEIISDYSYLESYFQEDRKPDLLLISEGYYNRMRKNGTLGAAGRLPATRVFLLSKEGTRPEGLPYGVRVPRDCAAHLPALVRQLYATKPKPEAARLATRLITVHSPLGRSGKTTVAMGLAYTLAEKGAKTLFLSMDRLQSCNWLLGESRYLPDDHLRTFTPDNAGIADDLESLVRRHGFYYIPPFSSPGLSLRIPKETYLHMATKLVEAHAYDCIVMDASCEFSSTVCKLMQASHNNVVIALQDANSSYKLNRMLVCLEDPFQEKFSYLCNLYRENVEDSRSTLMKKTIGERISPYNPRLDGEQIIKAAADPAFAHVMQELTGTMY